MRVPRVIIALSAAVLLPVTTVPAAAQDTPDLTGTWELDVTIFLPESEEPCVYEGDVSLSDNDGSWIGTPELELVSGPAECPVEMMGDLVGTLAEDAGEFFFHGTITGGQLGEASYNGQVFPDSGPDGDFALEVTSGPFQGASGDCLAEHQEPPPPEADLALSQVATVNAAAATTQDGDTPRAAANGEVTVDFALEVTNAGPDDATGVVMTNELPECTEVLSDDCGGAAGPPWTWTIGDLASGASASCNLTVDASECSGAQTATGQVSADTGDPDPDDNTAEVTFEIEDVPALPALALAVLAAALAWVATRLLRRERATESPLGR